MADTRETEDEEDWKSLESQTVDVDNRPVNSLEVLLELVDAVGGIYNVYLGFHLLLVEDQPISGSMWLGFVALKTMVVMAVIAKDSTAQSTSSKVAMCLAELFQVGRFYAACMCRSDSAALSAGANTPLLAPNQTTGSSAVSSPRKFEHRILRHRVLEMVRFFTAGIPLLFIAKYQAVLSVFIGKTDTNDARQFVSFLASALISSVSLSRAMLAAELYRSQAALKKKGSVVWRQMIRSMGLAGKRSRFFTMTYRTSSLFIRVLSFCMFLVNLRKSESNIGQQWISMMTYVVFSYFLTSWYSDQHKNFSVEKDYRTLGKQRVAAFCANNDMDQSDVLGVALWNILAPTEQPGLFYPMPTTAYRFLLVLSYELESALGLFAAVAYAQTAHREKSTLLLMQVLFAYYLMNFVLMAVWFIIHRKTTWACRRCSSDEEFVQLFEEQQEIDIEKFKES